MSGNSSQYNFLIPVIDTDSLTISKPDGSPFSQEEIDRLTKEINSLTPELINWEFEFYIPRIITIKSKNYVLDYGNEVKTKGSSLRDQKKEPAMKELMNNLIGEMLGENNIDTLVLIYKKYVQEAMNVTDIMRWSTKKTISDKVLAGRNPKADVRKQELDVWKAIQHEDDTQEGNKVHLYPVILGEEITPGGVSEKTGKPLKDKVKVITGLKLAKYWDNDHNVEHLISRVYATIKIFKNVLDMDQFIDYSKKKNTPLLEDLKNEVIDLKLNTTNIEMDEDDDGTDEDEYT